MAELRQPSARQQTTTFVIIGLVVVLIIGVAALFLSPSSPLRPQAAEITSQPTTFTPPQLSSFRNGTISKVTDTKITADEPDGGSFTFAIDDNLMIRDLNSDNQFVIADRSHLHTGDTISVFYLQGNSIQSVGRVDIIKAK